MLAKLAVDLVDKGELVVVDGVGAFGGRDMDCHGDDVA